MQIFRLVVICWILALGVTGCSDSGILKPPRNVHTKDWINPTSPNFHAKSVTSPRNLDSCKTCHGLNLAGNEKIPGCSNCHLIETTAPVNLSDFNNISIPAVSWNHGDSHTELADYGNTCNACHDSLRAVGQGPEQEQCHDCHTHTAIANYFDPAQHAPDAKGSINNPGGLLECVVCHGNPAQKLQPNQAFTVGIVPNGCENCHNPNTAHPTQPLFGSSIEQLRWYDAVTGDPTSGGSHNDVSKTAVSGCYICHPAGASDFALVGPGCLSCHVTDPMRTAKGDCVSCHGNPPDGSAVPNRAGAHANHTSYACSECHTNDGPDSQDGVVDDPNAVNHFRYPSPQNPDRYFRADVKSDFGSYDAPANNFTCVAQCHESRNWY